MSDHLIKPSALCFQSTSKKIYECLILGLDIESFSVSQFLSYKQIFSVENSRLETVC